MNGPELLALAGATLLAGVIVLHKLIRQTRRISKEELMNVLTQGAQIVDVRTPREFAQAHAQGSRNIPLNELAARVSELECGKPVVVCCASGARSAVAKSLLERAGFTLVHDAGPWQCLMATAKAS